MNDEPKWPTSHDYARELHRVADWFLERPEFIWPYSEPGESVFLYTSSKEEFVRIVRALGSGKKEFTETAVKYTVSIPPSRIQVEARREVLCRLIQPAQWECDPLLDIPTQDTPAQPAGVSDEASCQSGTVDPGETALGSDPSPSSEREDDCA